MEATHPARRVSWRVVAVLVGALAYSWIASGLRPFTHPEEIAVTIPLAVAGIDGTLEHRLQRRPARGQVIAKTGTTRLASALSGFVRDRYVFAILQNGRPIATYWARLAQDRFATALATAA